VIRRALAALAVAAALLACDDATQPTDPVWGKQPCAACSMLVSERRHAAELTTARGDRLFFDDVGCLAHYLRHAHPDVRGMWARAESGWVDARAARYARGQKTPMDYGFTAAADGDASFDDVERALAARAAAPSSGDPR
jgi:hypothetical protein